MMWDLPGPAKGVVQGPLTGDLPFTLRVMNGSNAQGGDLAKLRDFGRFELTLLCDIHWHR